MSNPPESNGLFVGNLKVRILDMDLEEINWPDKAASKMLMGTSVFTKPDFKSSVLMECERSRNLLTKAVSVSYTHLTLPTNREV